MWLERLSQEHRNLQEAIRWALDNNLTEAALRIAGALYLFMDMGGSSPDEIRLVLATLELGRKTDATRQSVWLAKALLSAGTQLKAQRNFRAAQTLLEESHQIYQSHNDQVGMGRTWYQLASCFFEQGNISTAWRMSEAGLRVFKEAEDHHGAGCCLILLATLIWWERDIPSMRSFLEQSMDELGAAGGPYMLINSRFMLANVLWFEGETEKARILMETNLPAARQFRAWMLGDYLDYVAQALRELGEYRKANTLYKELYEFDRAMGIRISLPYYQCRQGELAYLQGDLVQARVVLEASIAEARAVESESLPWQLCILGNIVFREGSLEQAEALIEECIAMQAASNSRRDLHYTLLSRGSVALAKGDFARAGQALRESLALVRERGMVPEIPPRLEAFAALAAAVRQPVRAACLFGASQALRERLGTPLHPVFRKEVDQHRAVARAALGDAGYAIEYAAGQVLSTGQAVEYAMESG
jgi:tetratricopeptide (TPR) repeat protein